MSLECWCAHQVLNNRNDPCEGTFPGYGINPAGYSQIEEYKNCNLLVLSSKGSIVDTIDVYDLTTGKLAGTLHQSDYRAERCPYPGYPEGQLLVVWAGRFPDASCVRSRCTTGQNEHVPGITPCGDGGI